jgi:hypothetical protein
MTVDPIESFWTFKARQVAFHPTTVSRRVVSRNSTFKAGHSAGGRYVSNATSSIYYAFFHLILQWLLECGFLKLETKNCANSVPGVSFFKEVPEMRGVGAWKAIVQNCTLVEGQTVLLFAGQRARHVKRGSKLGDITQSRTGEGIDRRRGLGEWRKVIVSRNEL